MTYRAVMTDFQGKAGTEVHKFYSLRPAPLLANLGSDSISERGRRQAFAARGLSVGMETLIVLRRNTVFPDENQAMFFSHQYCYFGSMSAL